MLLKLIQGKTNILMSSSLKQGQDVFKKAMIFVSLLRFFLLAF